MPTVLITGPAGLVGRHVLQEATSRGVRLTLMSHRRPVTPPGPGHRTVTADLAAPASLRGICEGVDVLLHCASYIGKDPDANEAVNDRGTRALVDEARRAGVSRIVYVSTASVYGRGTFRDADPGRLVRNPGSPTSRTRAAAEDAVLDAGGIILRPHLVYGPGDTWVVPGLLRLLRALPGTVEGWSARMSVVSVRDLARLVVGAGLAPAADLTAAVYHAAHPTPEPASTLLRTVAACFSLPWPEQDMSVAAARAHLAADGRSAHGLDMLTTDHWFDGAPLWRDLRLTPGPDFGNGFPESAEWYRGALLTA
ncbi:MULTISPECIES: NAD-dependent epimerase/dehydratase family protein [Streptomyces]|uniref:NAD-dependent epimerase/dehydratase family protein n=1 Tax=Streptomyces TaxID=1883 RepID=UPI001E3151B6|nr:MULTISPECIES: NAD-dependent epimerase/dehydratase family protein [Streptomyces]UFQ16204.1 NAD-dependent epimerase/dehydratase family protein [Streptomyces huasconensis]WCL85808.1 NAD-dependent epimerase/dehydratase family protein [Streptomyces sp. JCM 35825]